MALDPFPLVGETLWLDFVNTDRGRGPLPPDRVPHPEAFARWCRLQHLTSGDDPFAHVVGMRSRLTELAEAMHEGRHPPSSAIAALNERLARSLGCQQLTRFAGAWRLRFSPARPVAALEAIARSAAAALADAAVVRRCAAADCSFVFADTTPAGSRRWCDAGVCGSHPHVERRRRSLR